MLTGVGLPIAAEATAPADAVLLRLGTLLTDAMAIESTAYAAAKGAGSDDHPLMQIADRRLHETGVVVAQIEAQQARTLPGLLVKAQALRWCRDGDPVTLEVFSAPLGDPAATDERLMVGILADLYAMAGSVGA